MTKRDDPSDGPPIGATASVERIGVFRGITILFQIISHRIRDIIKVVRQFERPISLKKLFRLTSLFGEQPVFAAPGNSVTLGLEYQFSGVHIQMAVGFDAELKQFPCRKEYIQMLILHADRRPPDRLEAPPSQCRRTPVPVGKLHSSG